MQILLALHFPPPFNSTLITPPLHSIKDVSFSHGSVHVQVAGDFAVCESAEGGTGTQTTSHLFFFFSHIEMSSKIGSLTNH